MKTKIISIIMILASSVFAFAEANTEVQVKDQGNQPCIQKRVCKMQKKGNWKRPQISPEQRQAFVQRMLLSLSDEDLAKLADSVDAVRKMSAEQKAEAKKALPKPEFRRADAQKMRGHRPMARGGHHHHAMARGKMCRGHFAPRCKMNCVKGVPAQPAAPQQAPAAE